MNGTAAGRSRTLYIECTSTYRFDHRTGIPRVVRNVVRHLALQGAAQGMRVVPVYFADGEFRPAAVTPSGELVSQAGSLRGDPWRVRARDALDKAARALPHGRVRALVIAPSSEPGLARLARKVVNGWRPADAVAPAAEPAPVAFTPDDALLLADLTLGLDMRACLAALREQRVFIGAIVDDLVPLQFSDMLPQDFVDAYRRWLVCVLAHADGVFAISRSVGDELARFRAELPQGSVPRGQAIDWFHLGHDMDPPLREAPPRRRFCRMFDGQVPVLLNVGWFDPRKNQVRLIEALDRLRERGVRMRLVLIGRRGLATEEVREAIRAHPRVAGDIHVVHDASDAEVRHAFSHARALIYPSLAEGFGLPLVEALVNGLPALVSDIPIFREIAGTGAAYFDPRDVDSMVAAVESFLLHPDTRTAAAGAFTWISWQESIAQLFGLLLKAMQRHAAAEGWPAACDVQSGAQRGGLSA